MQSKQNVPVNIYSSARFTLIPCTSTSHLCSTRFLYYTMSQRKPGMFSCNVFAASDFTILNFNTGIVLLKQLINITSDDFVSASSTCQSVTTATVNKLRDMISMPGFFETHVITQAMLHYLAKPKNVMKTHTEDSTTRHEMLTLQPTTIEMSIERLVRISADYSNNCPYIRRSNPNNSFGKSINNGNFLQPASKYVGFSFTSYRQINSH